MYSKFINETWSSTGPTIGLIKNCHDLISDLPIHKTQSTSLSNKFGNNNNKKKN